MNARGRRFLLGIVLPSFLAGAAFCAPLPRARRWACFYGRALSQASLKNLDFAILDPDAFEIPPGSGPARLAYVSAGEVHETRGYWGAAKGRPWVVEDNPDWPGAHRVDMRSPQWRALMLEKIVPEALARGYQGVFLDTLDAAAYLESKDSSTFAGSVKGAEDLVKAIRAQNPGITILVNNAFPLLPGLGATVDGVVVEDLYTRCAPKALSCGPTPADVAEGKEALLRGFMERTGKPVFVLLYAGISERKSAWVRSALRRCRKNGFRPYLATPSLERFGVIDPGGDAP